MLFPKGTSHNYGDQLSQCGKLGGRTAVGTDLAPADDDPNELLLVGAASGDGVLNPPRVVELLVLHEANCGETYTGARSTESVQMPGETCDVATQQRERLDGLRETQIFPSCLAARADIMTRDLARTPGFSLSKLKLLVSCLPQTELTCH